MNIFTQLLASLVRSFKPKSASPTKPATSSVPIISQEMRKWRLTYYWIAEQARHKGVKTVPVYAADGKTVLSRVEPAFFAEMSLQGTGKMRDGKLLNVTGNYVPARHEDFSAVLAYHEKYLKGRPSGYSGISVKDGKVVAALAFRTIPIEKLGLGYGTIRGVPLEPFRTLAADIGATGKAEPRWKGKGGVVPPLTKVYIPHFLGKKFPDGKGGTFTHDGWFIVNDTGGGIYGKHFDVFVGVKSLVDAARKMGSTIPGHTSVTYDGIEERVPPDDKYDYGLHDKKR